MVRIEKEECIGCETCVPACPVNAISMVDGVAVIDPKTCTQCEACVPTCPVEAIKVE